MKDFTWRDFQKLFFNAALLIIAVAGYFAHQKESIRQHNEALSLSEKQNAEQLALSKKQHLEAIQLEKDRDIAAQRRADLQKKMELFGKISSAALEIRTAVYEIETLCHTEPNKYNGHSSDDKLKRYRAQNALISVGDETEIVFNQDFVKKIDEYIKFDIENSDPCSPNAPKDADYRKQELIMNRPFLKDMESLKRTYQTDPEKALP